MSGGSKRYFARESGSPWLNFIRISVGKGEIGPRRRRVPATLPRIRQARRNLDITSRYAGTVVEIGSHPGWSELVSTTTPTRRTVRGHNSSERDVNTTHNVKRIIFGALLSGGVAVAGLGLGAGTAQAYTYGPFQWCPGQDMPNDSPRPEGSLDWDMSVCHTYWFDYDVQTKAPAQYWEGPNPFSHSTAAAPAPTGGLPPVVAHLGALAVRRPLGGVE